MTINSQPPSESSQKLVPVSLFLTTTMSNSRPTTAWTATATRPRTAQSRPGTARPGTGRPQTGASTRFESSSYVIAVFEGRGVAREVGLAAIDKDTARVMLVQVSNTLHFKTFAFIVC